MMASKCKYINTVFNISISLPMQVVFVATLAWVLSSIYLFLLTALYFIYYIEFMSLCCHGQAPQQHVLRNVASLLSLPLFRAVILCMCYYCQVST